MGMINAPHAASPVASSAPLVVILSSRATLPRAEAILRRAPEASNCAYVVCMTEDDIASALALLSRDGAMPVAAVCDGLELETNHVYVGAVNRLPKLVMDVFRPSPRRASPAPAAPAVFFQSLTRRDPFRTVAIVLDGQDSRSVQAAQFLQDHAIPILRPGRDQEVPTTAILAAVGGVAPHRSTAQSHDAPRQNAAAEVLAWIEEDQGLCLTEFCPETLERRILQDQRRLGLFGTERHIDRLKLDPAARETLLRNLLPGTARFYDTPRGLSALRRKVLTRLLSDPNVTEPLRVWLPACAAGAEAYTVTIAILEALRAAGRTRNLRVIATGLHRDALDRASSGGYPKTILSDLPRAWRSRYFKAERDTCQVRDLLRGKITFALHDTLNDPPFLDVDLIVCRHMLSDLRDVPRARATQLFQFSLKHGGYVMLGPNDPMPDRPGLIRLDRRWNIFRKGDSE